MHWRQADETNETVSQRRARQADLAAQVIDCPTPSDIAVQQRQRPPNVRLAQPGEPSRLTVRQRLCVTPHRFRVRSPKPSRIGDHPREAFGVAVPIRCPILECRADPDPAAPPCASVRICANKVVAGVRCSTLLPNIRQQDTRQFASAQQINQLEGLALQGVKVRVLSSAPSLADARSVASERSPSLGRRPSGASPFFRTIHSAAWRPH